MSPFEKIIVDVVFAVIGWKALVFVIDVVDRYRSIKRAHELKARVRAITDKFDADFKKDFAPKDKR